MEQFSLSVMAQVPIETQSISCGSNQSFSSVTLHSLTDLCCSLLSLQLIHLSSLVPQVLLWYSDTTLLYISFINNLERFVYPFLVPWTYVMIYRIKGVFKNIHAVIWKLKCSYLLTRDIVFFMTVTNSCVGFSWHLYSKKHLKLKFHYFYVFSKTISTVSTFYFCILNPTENNTVTAVLSEMLLTPLHRYIINVFMLHAYSYFSIHLKFFTQI